MSGLAAQLILASASVASAAERICTRTRRSSGFGYEETCFSSDDPIYKSGQAAGAALAKHPAALLAILVLAGLFCLYVMRERER